MQRHAPFLGRPVPVVTKAEFRTRGFTGAHLRGADFHGWPTTASLVEHVRALSPAARPSCTSYYPGVDEVAHAFGLERRFYTGELRAADRLVGAIRDVLPDDVALLVTADHGQVNLGQESWIGLGALDGMIDAYAGDARFRYLHARDGAAKELLVAAEDTLSDHAWVFST